MWDPFRDLDRILSRVHGSEHFSSTCRGSWVPTVDLIDKPDAYHLYVDLPGMSKEDVKVDMDENRLCVSGIRKLAYDEADQQYAVLSERGAGRFERCFEVSHRVAPSSVQASFKNSTLFVELKKEATKAMRHTTSVKVE